MLLLNDCVYIRADKFVFVQAKHVRACWSPAVVFVVWTLLLFGSTEADKKTISSGYLSQLVLCLVCSSCYSHSHWATRNENVWPQSPVCSMSLISPYCPQAQFFCLALAGLGDVDLAQYTCTCTSVGIQPEHEIINVSVFLKHKKWTG